MPSSLALEQQPGFSDGHVSFEGLPPFPVLWFTHAIDWICHCCSNYCTDWRDYFGFAPPHPLGWKMPGLVSILPPLLTYQDFCNQQATGAGAKAFSCYSWQSLYQYMFETNSTALGDLTTPTALLFLVFLVVIIRCVKSVIMPIFRSIGRKAGRRAHGPDWEANNQDRIVKFGEYVFRLLYHSAISVYGVYYFYDKEWWSNELTSDGLPSIVAIFRGYPKHTIEPGMAVYYALQAAYNVDAFISLMVLSFDGIWLQWPRRKIEQTSSYKWQWPVVLHWSESVRPDFSEMAIHHIITNLLIFGSSFCRMGRAGSMVFLVHDLSDVPVDLSKLANFLRYRITTIGCFVLMTIVWIITRLYILPVRILLNCSRLSHYLLEEGSLDVTVYAAYRHFFYGGLSLLVALHVAWFCLFLNIFKTLIVDKVAMDPRDRSDQKEFAKKKD